MIVNELTRKLYKQYEWRYFFISWSREPCWFRTSPFLPFFYSVCCVLRTNKNTHSIVWVFRMQVQIITWSGTNYKNKQKTVNWHAIDRARKRAAHEKTEIDKECTVLLYINSKRKNNTNHLLNAIFIMLCKNYKNNSAVSITARVNDVGTIRNKNKHREKRRKIETHASIDRTNIILCS